MSAQDRLLIRCSSRGCLSVAAWPLEGLRTFEAISNAAILSGWSMSMCETTSQATGQPSKAALALLCPRCTGAMVRTEQRNGRKLLNI